MLPPSRLVRLRRTDQVGARIATVDLRDCVQQRSMSVVYRKGELSRATIDRNWPHQLALSADFLRGKNCIIVERFCGGLSVCPRNRKYWRDGKEHVAYCFTERRDAEFVQMHFGGEFIDPRNLGPWSAVNGGRRMGG